MKDYINFEGLSHFFNKLPEKFASIKHTHTKSEITDLENAGITAIDDGNGNVTLAFSVDINSSNAV